MSAVAAAQNPDSATILIVDDFELVRSLVQQVVMSLGYNTIVAANGKEAVEQARAHYKKIAMVLMDCEMPIMDGYQATEGIRAYEEEIGISPSKELFVCAMTANAMREDVKKCYSRRMSGFLAKPVKRSDLEKILLENAKAPLSRGASVVRPGRRSRKGSTGRKGSSGLSLEGSPFRLVDEASSSSSSSAGRRSRGARGESPAREMSPVTLAPLPDKSSGPSRRKKRGKAVVDTEASL